MGTDDQGNSPAYPGSLRVFIGYDPRQPIAYNVLQHSIVRHASRPVSITPLILGQLPLKRRGLTEFTYSRYLVPWLCGYEGLALFLDADMVVKGDIAEIFTDFDGEVAMQIHQPQFEWASAMLYNCPRCRILSPEFIEDKSNLLFDYHWTTRVGKLPEEWNRPVGYSEPADSKLYHYTQGIPVWDETRDLEGAPFVSEAKAMLYTVSFNELMGNSVHAATATGLNRPSYTQPETTGSRPLRSRQWSIRSLNAWESRTYSITGVAHR
jgi:hypothetical protein